MIVAPEAKRGEERRKSDIRVVAVPEDDHLIDEIGDLAPEAEIEIDDMEMKTADRRVSLDDLEGEIDPMMIALLTARNRKTEKMIDTAGIVAPWTMAEIAIEIIEGKEEDRLLRLSVPERDDLCLALLLVLYLLLGRSLIT